MMLLTDGLIAEDGGVQPPQNQTQLPCSRCGELLRSPAALHRHYTELCPAKDNSLYGSIIAGTGQPYMSPGRHDHDELHEESG